jgi:predicted transposase YbfD/YdcC
MNLKGSTISIDAAGCQKSIAQLIKDKKGDYVLGLKRNHPKLHKAIENHIKQKGQNDTNRLHDVDCQHFSGQIITHIFG